MGATTLKLQKRIYINHKSNLWDFIGFSSDTTSSDTITIKKQDYHYCVNNIVLTYYELFDTHLK